MDSEEQPIQRKKAGRKPRAKDATLTRRELAVSIHKRLQEQHPEYRCSAALVLDVVQLMIDEMADAIVKNRHIEFRDFGVFEVLTRKQRLGRNPNEPGQTVIIPARKTVKFKLSRKLLDKLSEPGQADK